MGKIEISEYPIVTVILRGYSYEQNRAVVSQLVGTKFNAVEIAMNTPGAPEIISRLVDEFGDDLLIGAGTVISEKRAHEAAEAGARFVLSPICFTPQIFEICRANEMFCVPAACTPTEVWNMLEMGADIVKVYPASTLGPSYFQAIQAPLNPLPLMAVGGVNPGNFQSFFDGGATYVGIGNGIFAPEDIHACNIEGIRASLESFEQKVRW